MRCRVMGGYLSVGSGQASIAVDSFGLRNTCRGALHQLLPCLGIEASVQFYRTATRRRPAENHPKSAILLQSHYARSLDFALGCDDQRATEIMPTLFRRLARPAPALG